MRDEKLKPAPVRFTDDVPFRLVKHDRGGKPRKSRRPSRIESAKLAAKGDQ